MRRAAKVDRNQAEIVKAFRQIGATVQVLSAVGKGCPDLLVGWRGRNFLVEIKDGELVPSARQLTADQQRWHGAWAGSVIVATSIEDAVTQVAKESLR
jgi:hypothetical protein